MQERNRAHVAPTLLNTLRDREVHGVAQRIQHRLACHIDPLRRAYASPRHVSSIDHARERRFAMLSDGPYVALRSLGHSHH